MMQNKKKILLGITGGSGCGKSTVSKALTECGAYILDADIIAREIVEIGKPALAEIEKAFGQAILNADLSLNRRALARVVFNDKNKLSLLNDITHKYISEQINKKLMENENCICGIDAAALIESGLDSICDYVIAVVADKQIRINRIIKRDCLSEQEALERINAQKDDSFYTSNADFVIVNNEDAYKLKSEVINILDRIRGEK